MTGNNLKREHSDLSREFFQSINKELCKEMKSILPRLGSFDEVL